MLINLREYHRPDSLADAHRLLARNPGRIFPLAGGTRLNSSANPAVEGLVDLAGLDLDRIAGDGREIRIGAMVRLQELMEHPLLRGYAGGLLEQAARSRSVSRMIRNQGTVGGELASGDPFSALAAAALALGARLDLYDGDAGLIAAAEYYAAAGSVLGRPSLITALRLPQLRPGAAADLQRLAVLPSSVPLLCVATSMRREKNRAQEVRIAISGGFPMPARLASAEALLEGKFPGEEILSAVTERAAADLEPPDDLRAESAYRRTVAPVLIRRSLERCWLQTAGQE